MCGAARSQCACALSSGAVNARCSSEARAGAMHANAASRDGRFVGRARARAWMGMCASSLVLLLVSWWWLGGKEEVECLYRYGDNLLLVMNGETKGPTCPA
jgi:hypothetical protein